MNKEVKAKWLEALRSGEYEQTKHTLKNKEGYCCLGVLCDIYQKEKKDAEWTWNEKRERFDFGNDSFKATDVLRPPIMEWAELDDNNPLVKEGSFEQSIAEFNDSGKEFTDLADIIEKQL